MPRRESGQTADRGRGRPRGSRLYDLSLNMVHANPAKMDANIGLSVLPVRQGKERHLLLDIDQLYLVSRNPARRSRAWAAGLFSRFTLVLAWILAFNALFLLYWRAKLKKHVRRGEKEQRGFGLAHRDPGDGAPHENADDQHPLGSGTAENRAGERERPDGASRRGQENPGLADRRAQGTEADEPLPDEVPADPVAQVQDNRLKLFVERSCGEVFPPPQGQDLLRPEPGRKHPPSRGRRGTDR